ncbi:MAG: endonuclease III [Dehalococcoidia bacterium]|nr:endonuclease III [Dehalococcoidia bacterium]
MVLRLPSRRRIAVGKLGVVSFPRGYYIYFGSALGGLRARTARHLRPDKKLHWHADYLSAEAPWSQVWEMADGQRWECEWAKEASALTESTRGITHPAPGFGSSDCKCLTHLIRVNYPQEVRKLLRALSPAPRRIRLTAT